MTRARHVRIQRARFDASPLLAAEMGGHRVLVALTDEGPFACTDRCPHRGAPLVIGGQLVTPIVESAGGLTLGEPRSSVRCPWHKWDFDLASGRCVVDDRLRLRTFHAWIDGDDVVVSMDPQGAAEVTG